MPRSCLALAAMALVTLGGAADARAQTLPEVAPPAEARAIPPLAVYPRREERPIPQPPTPPTFGSVELRRYPDIAEAGQGAAAAGDVFYAIVNTRIGKYAKADGAKLAEWAGDPTLFVHLNACALLEGRLMCGHSNFPHVPMVSSVEVFDPQTLGHVQSISLGEQIGSLTWIDRRDNAWWALFANYDERGGQPGRDHRNTTLVKFDDQWRRMESWGFPPSVLERFAPTSSSGGGWGDDGLLYVSGHDAPELYVLALPEAGSVLRHVATVNVGFEGQGWAWDRTADREIWSIASGRAVVVTHVPHLPIPPARP
jgi:hypothetical protein